MRKALAIFAGVVGLLFGATVSYFIFVEWLGWDRVTRLSAAVAILFGVSAYRLVAPKQAATATR